MRVRLDLAYLGTGFEGWQVQAPRAGSGEPRTVQGTLEDALARLYGRRVPVHAAGRTDAGVHAEQQVAHLDTGPGDPAIPFAGLLRGLNAVLPADVRVVAAAEVEPAFHARFSALGKRYVYRMRRGELLMPHAGLIETLVRGPLDVAAMAEAGRRLVGRRDFALFGLTGTDVRTTVRTLVRLDLVEEGSLLRLEAVGDGFLRGMVRRIAGTLLDVGRGRTRPDEALRRPGPVAPARGLTLERVYYAELPPGPTVGARSVG